MKERKKEGRKEGGREGGKKDRKKERKKEGEEGEAAGEGGEFLLLFSQKLCEVLCNIISAMRPFHSFSFFLFFLSYQ